MNNQEFIRNRKEFVGVVPPSTFKTLAYPKQLLLMFDKIAVDLANNLTEIESKIISQARPEIDWLSSEGLLTTLSGIIANNKPELDKKDVLISGGFLLPSAIEQDFNQFVLTTLRASNGLHDLRSIASNLRLIENLDAVAVGLPNTPIDIDKKISRDIVIKITLNEFPMPSDSTPWESILDFKKNGKSMEQFSRLKVWMNKMGTKEIQAFEAIDELQEIMHSYEQQMKLSEMKTTQGVIEAILTTPFEIMDNLLRFKFADAVKTFFKIKKQNIKLLEEERKTDGKEIAYIVNAKKRFGK